MARLFSGRAIPVLLRIFLLNPSRRYYQRELVDLVGERLSLVQAALARLSDARVVTRIAHGNRAYYQADTSQPAFAELRALIVKTFGLGDVIREGLRSLQQDLQVVFIYGSVARGDDKPSSDIDLMLIGEVPSRRVASALSPVKRDLNREVNPSVYSASAIRRALRERHPFIREVLEGQKSFLIGDESVLRSVLRRRTA